MNEKEYFKCKNCGTIIKLIQGKYGRFTILRNCDEVQGKKGIREYLSVL